VAGPDTVMGVPLSSRDRFLDVFAACNTALSPVA
jgi:hypothetical protein